MNHLSNHTYTARGVGVTTHETTPKKARIAAQLVRTTFLRRSPSLSSILRHLPRPSHMSLVFSTHQALRLFTCHLSQLLDKLPHTVRGMGVALLGGHQPITFGEGLQQGKRHRLGNLAGFIVVVRMYLSNNLLNQLTPRCVAPPQQYWDLRTIFK